MSLFSPIPGNKSGTTISSGYIGEKIVGTVTNGNYITTTIGDASTTIDLSPGVWRIHYSISGYASGPSTTNSLTIFNFKVTTSTNTILTESETYAVGGANSGTNISARFPIQNTRTFDINISSSTSYKLRAVRIDDTGGAALSSNIFAAQSYFYAVRVG